MLQIIRVEIHAFNYKTTIKYGTINFVILRRGKLHWQKTKLKKTLASNYDIKIIDMKKNNLNLNNQNNKDLFKVLSIVYDNEKDRKERGQELAEYEYSRRIDDKVIDVIAATTGVKIDYDKEGERKVCRLWEELREDGRDEGALINLISLCCQKYKKGLPPEVAADHLEQKVEDIKRIYAAIEATNTQDADEIYKYLFGDADR